MSDIKIFKHWAVISDENQIEWLSFNRADSSTNSISDEVLTELEEFLDQTAHDPETKALVICSGKSNGFIAGADIEGFKTMTEPEQALSFIRKGQHVFAKLKHLSIPTIAMIEGFCLGGGLELALACDYRVAVEDPKTKLGLPEVMLGIHPGWGGTVRLPQLCGAINAMDLILSGRTVSAKAAQKMGFVDAAVPKRQLKRAAEFYALNKPAKHQASKLQALTNHSLVRPLLAKVFRNKVAKKAKEMHYPAPYAAIDCWEKHGAVGEAAYKAEAESIAALLAGSETAKNLVRVFFLQERMKSLAKGVEFKAEHVHVIGAGVMGGDIAAWCALQGMTVTLHDQGAEYIAPVIARAHKLFTKKLKEPRLVQAAMDRLIPDIAGHGAEKADVVIEAIFESLEAKQKLFKDLEGRVKPACILATNTSSIPLGEISLVMKSPKRLVGIHFFNPVARMPLVEVVADEKTDKKVIAQSMAFVRSLSRLPLPVKSSPGFLVNRVLMPYLMECMLMIEEGIPGPEIDKAAENFGMPMGPVELADVVGLDVCLSVAKNLCQYFGGSVPERLERMVELEHLGKKSGRGFYTYINGKPQKEKVKGKVDPRIANRLVLRLVNEAAACLREGVVEDTDLLDAGMIFGTGFAPFTGGPMQYARKIGKGELQGMLQQYERDFGERFKADSAWDTVLKAKLLKNI